MLRAAAHQLLAGRRARLRERPHLSAAGRDGAPRRERAPHRGAALRQRLARSDGIPGRPLAGHDPLGPAARALAARAHRPRDPRHHPGRPAHPREDRAGELRRLPAPAGAARLRLAAAAVPRGLKTRDRFFSYATLRILPAEGSLERLELLLLISLPSSRAPPRHHRAL